MQSYQDLLSRAQGVASTPYQGYSGELVAPQNAEQNTGVAGINQYSNFAQPYIQQAGQMATSAAAPITQQQIQNYESPYTQQVVDATQAQFANQNATQMQGVKGNAISQGALGGNREAIAEAETANQQNLAQAPVIAGLKNQGYQTGLNTALTEQQAQAAGAYSLGNIGVSGQGAGLSGAGMQLGAGTAQQQTQQAQDAATYQQYINQLAYPYQQTQWLAGLDTGVGSQMGGTSSGTTTGPAPSSMNSWLGLGSAGIGAVGQMGGFAALAALASGGAVGRANGGGVAPDSDSYTIPESHETLVAQQRQLVAGHRRVQMFPHGTPELRLPHGMDRVVVNGEVFHYDPNMVDASQIKVLAAHGRENELLDLGPVSKHEVISRIHRGEIPVAVVERHPDGTEVRAAAGTHLTAHHQLAAMHRTKSPGNSVNIEDPRTVLADRMHRAWGGRVQSFDTGGGVANPSLGGALSGMPYGGGQGWIPSIGISRGAGAPHASAPGASQPQQAADPSAMGKQIGAMAKSISGGLANQPMNIDPLGGNSSPTQAGDMMPSTGVAPFSPTDFSGSAGAIFHRGGTVGRYASGGIANLPTHNRIMMPHGYAGGGSPYDPPFDPTLGGIAPGPDQFNVDPSVDAVAQDILSGGVPLRQSAGFDQGIAGPQESSPLDTEQWPSGPIDINTPAMAKSDREAPAGQPTFNDRFTGEPAPAPSGIAPSLADQGVSGASVPLGRMTSQGFVGPTPVVTGTQAIPDAAAANISTPTSGYVGNMQKYGHAIDSIEGGNYGAVGPLVTYKDGTTDHAYGSKQVMGKNIPSWTKEVLGVAMTPQQFLNNKDAQDTVFKAKFGQLVNKYGPEGAAKAWFAGEGGMHNPAAHDVNNMTVDRYGKQFMAALNGGSGAGAGAGAGTRTAGVAENPDDAALPPNARPVQSQGVAPSGIDLSANSKLWPSLMSAGFGMMASRSPFPGVAFGEGAQAGMAQYGALRQQEQAAKMKQSELDMEVKKLSQAADIAQKNLALKTQESTGGTWYQRQEAAKPVLLSKSVDSMGRTHEVYGQRMPDGTMVDPATRKPIDASTLNGSQSESSNIPQPTGEEFLNGVDPVTKQPYVDPKMRNIVRQVAGGDVDISKATGMRDKFAVSNLAAQYDPSYNTYTAPARQAMVKEFTSGGLNSPAAQITAGTTGVIHADRMLGYIQQMKQLEGGIPGMQSVANAGVPYLSKWAAAARNSSLEGTGTPAAQAYSQAMALRELFTDEIKRFYSGSQAGEYEKKRALENIDMAKSLPELEAAVRAEGSAMADKVGQLQSRFEVGMGPMRWGRAIASEVPAGELDGKKVEFPIIRKAAADALAHIMATDPANRAAAPGSAQPNVVAPIKIPAGMSAADAIKAYPGKTVILPDGRTKVLPGG